ncbi:hypothetical protein K435DRAFT_868147 [Dendrothele bispora CBS 962.96]|uniref:Ribonuclease H1 N-terminal domain-containing protein n=1 Tax=Dendrothele bispora (strain CBS 962.96) TaxID=1314807 RepID=A0A4S8LCD8_DENBC|nr:hypothetical protein K435DRAFT_868147 [Dendrothele bispora CBS 962.96]
MPRKKIHHNKKQQQQASRQKSNRYYNKWVCLSSEDSISSVKPAPRNRDKILHCGHECYRVEGEKKQKLRLDRAKELKQGKDLLEGKIDPRTKTLQQCLTLSEYLSNMVEEEILQGSAQQYFDDLYHLIIDSSNTDSAVTLLEERISIFESLSKEGRRLGSRVFEEVGCSDNYLRVQQVDHRLDFLVHVLEDLMCGVLSNELEHLQSRQKLLYQSLTADIHRTSGWLRTIIMNSDFPASFQLPPGSKVTIAYPDTEGNCGTQEINVSAGNLTVEPPVDPFAAPVGTNIDEFEFSPSDFEYYSSDEEEELVDDAKDLPVFKYLAFARPAHPDELLWDHTRGTGCVYAITRGRRVGLFWDWEVVRDLTFLVPNASYQKFETLDDAIKWYTAGYDNQLGHANLAIVPAHRLPKEPLVDVRMDSGIPSGM